MFMEHEPGATGHGTSREDIMQNGMAATKFKENLRGALIRRTDPEYDGVRKLYNGMIDKRPLMIARCADVADVITAVNFGRDNDLLIAICGGGHNGPGLGSCDDGLVINLSAMNGVRVDTASHTVRVGPGCTQGDVDHATRSWASRPFRRLIHFRARCGASGYAA
jgi:FAD/FMN-containing dehydrogenase